MLFAVFSVMLASAIIVNLNAGKEFRRSLATRMDQLRLSKMITALGLDNNHYLHSQSIADIEKRIHQCSSCENTERCDEQLSEQGVTTDDIAFCNNEESLQEMVRGKA